MTTDDTSSSSPDEPHDSERLPDDAVVMRFGLSRPADLRKTALAHLDATGDYAISVFSAPGLSADDLARVGALPHGQIRETTAGSLRAAGFEVVRAEPPPAHALIKLANMPGINDYETVSAIFGPPRVNPMRNGGTS